VEAFLLWLLPSIDHSGKRDLCIFFLEENADMGLYDAAM